MERTDKNPVILIGGNHYNGLGLVRMFARFGIDAYGIIIGKDTEQGFLARSRYWKKTWHISSDAGIMETLAAFDTAGVPKPVVIAWSDGAAAELDRHYDELSGRFILPSIGRQEGALYGYMDKEKQRIFGGHCGLLTAKSLVLDPREERSLAEVSYPCICKPLISCEGNKKDIRKMDDEEQLRQYLAEKKADGYEKILLQEYLDIDIEYDILGCVDHETSAFLVNRKVRTWPDIGGPTSYSFTVRDPQLDEIAGRIIGELRQLDYSGLFDVDLFCVGGRFYFNEINWRNSALGYIAANSKLYYPVIWYDAVTGQSLPGLKMKPDVFGLYSMNEFADIHHVLKKEISLSEWRRQYRACTGFAYKDPRDPAPARAKITGAVKNRLTRKKTDQENA